LSIVSLKVLDRAGFLVRSL